MGHKRPKVGRNLDQGETIEKIYGPEVGRTPPVLDDGENHPLLADSRLLITRMRRSFVHGWSRQSRVPNQCHV